MTTEETLREALQLELKMVWSDFGAALDKAIVQHLNPLDERRGWSIEMLNIADRIAAMAKLVGSPRWEEIDVRVLLEGWWEVVHRRANLPVPDFDRERAEAVYARRRA